MADTSQQLMIEMNRQLEELRLQQTKQAEEQSAWNQELKEELKDVLREIFGTELSNLRQQSARNQELKEKLKCDELIHRDEEPSQILVPNETNSAKEPSDRIAHQVLDKMSEPKESHNLELSDEEKLKCDELIHRDVEPSQFLVENEPNSAKESSVLIAHQVLDKMSQSTKTIEVNLIGVLTKDDDDDDLFELASWIEEDFEPPTYTKGYMKLMCFDPGGNFVGVLLERHIVDYDLSYYCHLNSIELIRWPAKLNLERSDFGFKTLIPTWSSPLISVELFIFDPGGMIISSASSIMPLVHKTLQEWSIEVRIAGKIATFGHKRVIHVGEVTAKLLYLKNGINGVYYSALYNDVSRYVCCAGYRGASSGTVFKKTYISVWKEALNPTLASVAYVLKFKLDVLIKLEMAASYLLNHVGLLGTGCRNLTFTWKYIYICFETFIFDPGGSLFLHSELKVTIARLIFDPGGQCYKLIIKVHR